MRILLVNWASIRDGAGWGGGINGYVQSLALALTARGHEVAVLSSGVTYVPKDAALTLGPPEVRRSPDFRGIRVFDAVNSPVLAATFFQFRNPAAEVSSPALERELARFFRLFKPDVVHFHSLEGLSIGCVDAALVSGAKVVFSLHNYHTLCSQVNLMQGARRPCHEFSGGAACNGCIATPDPDTERQSRAAACWKRDRHPHPAFPDAGRRHTWRILGREVAEMWRRYSPIALPGRAVNTDADLGPDAPQAPAAPHPAAAELNVYTDDSDRIPLDNVAAADPSSGSPVNEYGRRRQAMIAMLSRCDRVLAVSNFVRDKFAAEGVDERVLKVLHIGSRMPEIVEAQPGGRAAVWREPPGFQAGRPIHLVFLGYHLYFKGLPMLADTLQELPPEVLGKYHLHVYAAWSEPMAQRLRRLEPWLGGLSLLPGYAYEDIPRLLTGRDIGIVPSVWWDNGPQTVMEFLSCGLPVIGAELGGIPDLIRHGENGLLFRGNDRAALARLLSELAHDPARIVALRKGVSAPLAITAHAVEMESIYANAGAP